MERLTERIGDLAIQPHSTISKLAYRLAEYEDTGLEPYEIQALQEELSQAKADIAEMLWLEGRCEYCKFHKKEQYKGATKIICGHGSVADCEPEWIGMRKEVDYGTADRTD